MEKFLILPNDEKISTSITKTYYDLLQDKLNENNYLGIKIDNEIMPLTSKAYKGGNVTFLNREDISGYKMYQAGLKMVLDLALQRKYPKALIKYDHSIDRGIHISSLNFEITDEVIATLKEEMDKIINENLSINRIVVDKKSAFTYFEKKDFAKACNISIVPSSAVTLYKLDNYLNYYYTEMPHNTKGLNNYDLVMLNDKELVLLFPPYINGNGTPSYIHYKKIIKCYKESINWAKNLDIPFVKDLNTKVANGEVGSLIKISELKYSNDIDEAVNNALKKEAKFILLAGPSSSGKTTTSKRIAFNLLAKGYKPLTISVDNYFKERVDTPLDENGNRDYENIKAIDTELLTSDLKKLLSGEEINPPEFNFITGKKEYNSKPLRLPPNGIIIMEGLHCLNDALLPGIENDLKYKIYLSPFYPINIDYQNYVSTVDLRLIRRIIRDERTRGYDVATTIKNWQQVRVGEEKYIFPYLNNADMIINTSLAYELGVLKVFAEPLLYTVTISSPYYEEAKRLLDFLHNFFPIASDYISGDSIIREFIGRSDFTD